MSRAERVNTQWLFPCLLISFCAIYLVYYPPSYGIEDEGNILQLSYSLSHGTIFPDHAGPYAGPSIDGHRVSKFSIFHAAMIAPLWKLDWRLGFALAALFFAAGAFVVRNWLRREKLNGDWTALYFLLFGALYYTQTRDGCRASGGRRTVRGIAVAARRAAADAGGPDVRRERPDASVDGSVRGGERHGLAA